jgi:hypothetical protein
MPLILDGFTDILTAVTLNGPVGTVVGVDLSVVAGVVAEAVAVGTVGLPPLLPRGMVLQATRVRPNRAQSVQKAKQRGSERNVFSIGIVSPEASQAWQIDRKPTVFNNLMIRSGGA